MYFDSLDTYYSIEPKQEKSTKKEDDSIITNKILVIFGIVAVIKIAILLLVT